MKYRRHRHISQLLLSALLLVCFTTSFSAETESVIDARVQEIGGLIQKKELALAQSAVELFWAEYGGREGFVEAVRRVKDQYWIKGEYAAHYALCDRIIDEFPGDTLAVATSADVVRGYIYNGDLKKAAEKLEDFWTYGHADEKFLDYARQIKDLYWEKKEYTTHYALCDRIIKDFPGHTLAVATCADVVRGYIYNGDLDKAAEKLEPFWTQYHSDDRFVEYARWIKDTYWQTGQRATHYAVCERIFNEFPDHPLTVVTCADEINGYIEDKELAKASEKLEQFWATQKAKEGFVEAARRIKDKYWVTGQHAGHYAVCERIINQFPDHPLTVTTCADEINGYIEDKELAKASEKLEQFWATQKAKDGFVGFARRIKDQYWVQGYRDQSQALCERIIAAFPDDPATASVLGDFICGRIAMGQDADTWQNVEAFWSRYQTHPEFVDMAYRIAHHYHHGSGDFGRAMELYSKLLQDYPDHKRTIDIERQVVAVYLEMDGKQMADLRVEKLLTEYGDHPSFAFVLNGFGDDYRKHGHFDDSIRMHWAALALKPSETEQLCAYAGMAKAQIQMGAFTSDPNDVESARGDEICPESIIERLVTDYTNARQTGFHVFQIAEEYYFLGERLMRAGYREQGKQAFETAIRLWENNKLLPDRHHAAMASYYAGVASGYIGDDLSALEYYQEVALDYPEYDKAWHARFMVAECAGRLSAADLMRHVDAEALQLMAYQEILDNDPNSPVDAIVRQRVQLLSR